MGSSQSRFGDEYTLGQCIAHGVSSQVRECRNEKDGNVYVVKIYSSNCEIANAIRYETFIRKKSNISIIPNILQLKDCFFEEYYIYYISQRYTGKDILTSVTHGLKYTENDLVHYFQQIFVALSTLHDANIVHRSISAHNIVFLDQECKNLVLRGFRYMINLNELPKFGAIIEHSLQYLSPEIILQSTTVANAAKSDVWACGVILYVLLFGVPLFSINQTLEKYSHEVINGLIRWDHESPLLSKDSLAIDFCKSLLRVNPEERLSAKDALLHPWLRDERIQQCSIDVASSNFYGKVKNTIEELNALERRTCIKYSQKFDDATLRGIPLILRKISSIPYNLSSKSTRRYDPEKSARQRDPGCFPKCLTLLRHRKFGRNSPDTRALFEMVPE